MILTGKKKGFTLIELMLVISIIGVLSSVILTRLNQAKISARDTRRIQDIQEIEKAFDLYLSDHNYVWPTTSSSWVCLGLNDGNTCLNGFGNGDSNITNTLAPYLSKIPSDPLTRAQDSYLFEPNSAGIAPCSGSGILQTGKWIIWYPENFNKSCSIGKYVNNSCCPDGRCPLDWTPLSSYCAYKIGD